MLLILMMPFSTRTGLERVGVVVLEPGLLLSQPDSRFDPIGGSEPSSRLETIY